MTRRTGSQDGVVVSEGDCDGHVVTASMAATQPPPLLHPLPRPLQNPILPDNILASKPLPLVSKTRRRRGSLRKVALLGRGAASGPSASVGLGISGPTDGDAYVSHRSRNSSSSTKNQIIPPAAAPRPRPAKPMSTILTRRSSPTAYVTTDEDQRKQQLPRSLSLPMLMPMTAMHPGSKLRAKSPLSLTDLATPLAPSSADPDWDYAETEWWGWVMLVATWVVFVVGMGSCLGVWSWAWDVGTTPYAPPELEDDPTLPIVGYYPALMILTSVMAWVWVVVAWIGMKSFGSAADGAFPTSANPPRKQYAVAAAQLSCSFNLVVSSTLTCHLFTLAMTDPPLAGLRVLELAGLAPAPFAGLIFADAGADVLRIDRALPVSSSASPSSPLPVPSDLLTRHKASVAVDLKDARGIALVRTLARRADVLIDPFRPGVLERLGLGPDVLLADNRRLIYARLSGFRRDGRYRHMAGHDINYLAVSGVLSLLGRADAKPTPPTNLLADFAGGGLMLAFGVLLALATRSVSGRGQVVEANMVDGAAYLATFARFGLQTPLGCRPRGHNLLDSGCPYYDTYACADAPANPNGYVAVGALEPRFFDQLLRGLTADRPANPALEPLADIQAWKLRRLDPEQWPALRAALTAAFRRHPRAHWEGVFDGTDACCTPVLGFAEIQNGAATHGRESDQRPPVALQDTPLLAVAAKAADNNSNSNSNSNSRGQGPGIDGEGYEGQALLPGEGGEEALKRWQGWTRGTEYDINEAGGFVLKGTDKARL
ncbi:isopenicillin n-transferase [Grosmannia clavigera kw1407]|uniref:Isopenicillin n-transferase n=1 Tax=Grosmannia clavigera (strain kw1407 / UAMH 11150) TaxID=655863 RepID=F0XMD0_GROCL|nr:isopenicillin n-transferase [Grosmannia clavigera kw1407]EFX01300.1 isopenicillin n-transferase [Grosmannia clavigera kw1407]